MTVRKADNEVEAPTSGYKIRRPIRKLFRNRREIDTGQLTQHSVHLLKYTNIKKKKEFTRENQ